MKPFLLLYLCLLFSIGLYTQENITSQTFDKYLYAGKIDTALLRDIKSDTNFSYKYYSLKRKDSAFLCSIYTFTLKNIPPKENADTIAITYMRMYFEKQPMPSFNFTFTANKTKSAKQEFQYFDNKISKVATKRWYDNKENKNEIHYLLPRSRFPQPCSIILTITQQKDNGIDPSWLVSIQFLD